MISLRRLLGVLLAAVLTATVLSMPSGAHAAEVRAVPTAAKADPVQDFPRMPRRCVDPKLLIPQQPGKCNLNKFQPNRPTVVLWGDSHAWQMIPALRTAARDRNVNMVAFLMGSCPAMDPALTPRQREGGAPACLISNDLALNYVKTLKSQKKRVHVLIGTYWARYLHVLRTGQGSQYERQMAGYWKQAGPRLFRTLGRLRVRVDVNGPMPAVPSNAEDCYTDKYFAYDCDLTRKQALRNEARSKRWVKRHMQALSGSPRFVDSAKMCSAKTCFAKPKGVYTFWDFQHISATMSRKLSYMLDKTVTRAGGRGKAHGGGPLLDGGGGGDDDDDGCFLIFCPK